MTLDMLLEKYPEVENYVRYMPEELKHRYTIRVFPPGYVIHQKHFQLDYFGIVCAGEHRVINEFEDGNVFMIEKNEPIDFVGEVTILADMPKTSVTIETLTECTVFMISRKDFEDWIAKDIHFLRLVSRKVAYKLYRSSYNQGARLFYPPNFLLLDYLVKYAGMQRMKPGREVVVKKTRQELYEELGMTVKTINRTVQRLKEEGWITVRKGKMVMDWEQYQRGKKEVRYEGE